MADLAETVKNVVETGAVIVGGWWTYRIFVKTRSAQPKATIAHKVSHRDLPEGRTLVQVMVTIKNEGTVKLEIPEGLFRLQQVLPLPDRVAQKLDQGEDPVPEGKFEVLWAGLGERRARCNLEIEPTESDQVTADFFLNQPRPELIEVYTYFQNVKKKKIGWGLTTLYEIQDNAEPTRHRVEALSGRSE